MPASSRAFTLIELLMVIGLAATIGGLVLFGLMGARQRSPLVTTEHLLRSTIRQAQQTAQSTGLPVEIRIAQERRTLSGVSNTIIIAENFEAQPGQGQDITSVPTPRVSTNERPITPGYAGYGWSLGIRDRGTANNLHVDRPYPLPLASPRGRRLLTTPGDGFAFSIMFKPSYLDDNRNATIQPVEIASVVDAEDLGTKISLELGIHREHSVNAWYYPRARITCPTGKGTIEDRKRRINGDNWIILTIAYDGDHLRLSMNERLVDQALQVPPFRFRGPAGVVIGKSSGGATGNRPIGIIDNVRLGSAGKGPEVRLPGSVGTPAASSADNP